MSDSKQRVPHGLHRFTLSDVYRALGMEDLRDPEKGVDLWRIRSSLGPTEYLAHQDARNRMMALLAQVRAAGWQRYINADMPRLSGKQAWHYALSANSTKNARLLDSTYTPTMSEWRDMISCGDTLHWIFQVDGVYLGFFLSDSGASEAKGSYTLETKIEDEYKFYHLADFTNGGGEIIKLTSTWLTQIKESNRTWRNDEETGLKALGYTIDTAYQDPPVKILGISSQAVFFTLQ